jgi:hypothetical protein
MLSQQAYPYTQSNYEQPAMNTIPLLTANYPTPSSAADGIQSQNEPPGQTEEQGSVQSSSPSVSYNDMMTPSSAADDIQSQNEPPGQTEEQGNVQSSSPTASYDGMMK